jgi:hypothetical protein
MKKKVIIALIGFFLGYIFASWVVYISGGVSPIDLKTEKERHITFLNSLNLFEPMSPGFYMILFANK